MKKNSEDDVDKNKRLGKGKEKRGLILHLVANVCMGITVQGKGSQEVGLEGSKSEREEEHIMRVNTEKGQACLLPCLANKVPVFHHL